MNQGKIIIPPRARQFFTTGVKFLFLEAGCVSGVPSIGGLLMDRRGRVTLPSKLRKVARIEDEIVVLVGLDNYFEVCGRKNWELEISQVQAKADRLKKSISKNAPKLD
jgi:bifunctional DNA-binding transcriptional regulator/antitoxin component of YhaV-PrlF toxin-antitoxin module